jgi:hydrogenase 3 maturation protease
VDAQSQDTLASFKEALCAQIEQGRLVVVFGIGSEICGDDQAGVLLAQAVQNLKHDLLKGVIGCSAPENVTGEIIALKPALIALVDAAEMRLPPGSMRLLPVEDIAGISFSTHSMPLSVIVHYLRESLGCDFLILGIQPRQTGFSSSLSPAVTAAVCELEKVLDTLAAANPAISGLR